MMKLKHLIDNRSLAVELLSHWEYDGQRLNTLDRFRISANAVYPFYRHEGLCFLRFSPIEEKSPEFVQAELDFIRYLKERGLPVLETVPALDGRELVVCETQWGAYLAVVFKRVAGQQVEGMDYSGELITGFGKALGKLHALSREYIPAGPRRPDWQQQLSWVQSILCGYNAPAKATTELEIVREGLSALPVSQANYGLIHYDFELDNVFYDRDKGMYTPIDFDDAVYHWFAQDVEATFRNIGEELPEEHLEQAQTSFLSGYRSVMELPDDMLARFPLFRRYAGLFQYARCLRATYEHYDSEPEWMQGLRQYLATLMAKNESRFGQR